nr:immunoglobulin heavy chain junction region [Mus musculus]
KPLPALPICRSTT